MTKLEAGKKLINQHPEAHHAFIGNWSVNLRLLSKGMFHDDDIPLSETKAPEKATILIANDNGNKRRTVSI